MLEVQLHFRQQFAANPSFIVRAPGRLELLGNHTDYNDGLVLALAVDKSLYMAVSSRPDGKIELVSSAFAGREKFSVGELKKNPAASWADYVKGVLGELRQRGVPFSGFNAAIHSTIPLGAGLSSSAALLVATALAVRQLYPYRLTPTGGVAAMGRNRRGELPALGPVEKLQFAKLCQAAENNFVGLNCGLLDPIASLFGKAHHAMEIDCKFLTVEHLPLLGEIDVIICHSGVKHELVAGAYNQLRQLCESAARKLGAQSLRSVEPSFLKANEAKLTEREYQCAYHIVGEIQRVVFGGRALRESDLVQFGQYMFQSHESSRDHFKNSCPELDLLVELAREHPGCLGSRLTGGGFGGATINLVARPMAADFVQAMSGQYVQKTGRALEPITCRIVDGAG